MRATLGRMLSDALALVIDYPAVVVANLETRTSSRVILKRYAIAASHYLLNGMATISVISEELTPSLL